MDDRGERLEFRFEKSKSNKAIKIVIDIKSNSAGIDDVNLFTFKVIMMYLLPSLLHIINTFLTTGTIPDALKHAKAMPLFKGGLKLNIKGNWRPISILPMFSKILKKLVHQRLNDHLTNHGLLSETQFSFQRGHSIFDAAKVDFVNNYHII